ncbi:MAG: type IX secretion system outer membrane channel protein PorV [Chitinophagaceae bacterium]|nr:type IX secretion system outer membrane channel protein PorV [Chitinophagaceae bacterium]
MKRSYLGLAAFSVLFFGATQVVRAQVTQPITTTAVPFLRISPDARGGGMGDLGVATTPDASSGFYNLSKTPFAKKEIGISLTYTPWLKDLGLNDVYLLAASGYKKLDDLQAISGGVRYFSLGNIQFTDNSGANIGTGNPREWGLDVGYSRKLSDKLSIGLAARYIYSNLAGGFSSSSTTYQPGKTFAADISLFYHGVTDEAGGWNFGLALSNLGGKIGYTNSAADKDYIPADLGLGTTYTAVFNEDNKLMLGLDIHKLLVPAPPADLSDSAALANYHNKSIVSSWFNSFSGPSQFKTLQASIGAEYSYQDQFFFRAGYYYEDRGQGDRKYFSVGVGVNYNVMGLNFSYLVPSGNGTTRNPLSNTLRFGLSFNLDSNNDNNSTPTTTP